MKKLLLIIIPLLLSIAGFSQTSTRGSLLTVDTSSYSNSAGYTRPTIKMLAVNRLDNEVVFWDMTSWSTVAGGSGSSLLFNLPMTKSGDTVSIPPADENTDGYITAADYTLFTSTHWGATGSDIYSSNIGNVGIGAAPGAFKLDVTGTQRVSGLSTFLSDISVTGMQIGRRSTQGSIVIGASTQSYTTLPQSSVFVGDFAGQNVTGINTTAIGFAAMKDATNSGASVAVGWNSMRYRTGGLYNTAVGYESMGTGIGTGAGNTALGRSSLKALTAGVNNIAIGYAAGATLLDGSTNILIGANIEASTTSISNELNIGGWIKGTNGKIGINVLPTTDTLEVRGNISLLTIGNKIKIATGTNSSIGVSAAMTAGSITISTTAVTSSSKIFLTHASLGGTQGILSVGTITDGTSFVINSSSGTDTGTVNWWIIN